MSVSARVEFSPRTRVYNLSRLRAEQFDVLVIGGGITGAGIAREASLRGYKTALLEKDDFASGTSSQSSKLVHGGVRYLQQFAFGLVFEASRERAALLKLAPNHVWPLPFVYPIYEDSVYSPRMVNLGLWMYDGLALFRNVERHRMVSTSEIATLLPQLDVSRIVGGARYYDAGTNDARLTLETARSAHRQGAVILNHVRVDAFSYDTTRRIEGIMGRDMLTHEPIAAHARVVVNASGPWCDEIIALDSPGHKPRLRPTKGIHLLVEREKLSVPAAVSFNARRDGRLMFIIPRGRWTLIGTTDTDYEGPPEKVEADAGDVAYVLDAVAGEFPNLGLGRQDIVSTFAGLRPLVAPRGPAKPSAVSREHEIWTSPAGLVTIAGGKLTTYRAMAEQLIRRVGRVLRRDFGIVADYPSRSARLPLIQSENGGFGLNRAQAQARDALPPETREHLARYYGDREGAVLDYVVADNRLSAPIVDGLPYLWAEVPHAVEHEMALTLDDVLRRRLDLFHELPDGAAVAARDVAGYMARLLDWLDPDVEEQVNNYLAAVDRNRRSLRG